MPRTVKNKEIVSKYKEMFELLYQEKDGRPVIGTIFHSDEPVGIDNTGTKRKRTHDASTTSKKSQPKSINCGKDIRSFFKRAPIQNKESSDPKEPNTSVIRID